MASTLLFEVTFPDTGAVSAWLATTIDLAPLPNGLIVGEYSGSSDDIEGDQGEPIEDITGHWNEVIEEAGHRQALSANDYKPRTIEAALTAKGLELVRDGAKLRVTGENPEMSFAGEYHLIKALHAAAKTAQKGRLLLAGVADIDNTDTLDAYQFDLEKGAISSDQLPFDDALELING